MEMGSCRFCGSELRHSFCDLGMTPLSNAYLTSEELWKMERFFPLNALVCGECFLVQLGEFESPEGIFGEYRYFSSYSDSWLDHARRYVESISERCHLGPQHQVVEIASNDGYLLQYFVAKGIPVLGVEPARNVAEVAVARGVPTVTRFFGTQLAAELVAEGTRADLLVGKNVLAHVPDLNDFVRGLQLVLKPKGTITMEFPHLLRLIEAVQFDTIYHEHFSYFSLGTVRRVFKAHGLIIHDVEQLPTHGGSLRIYAGHEADAPEPSTAVAEVLRLEAAAGLDTLSGYLRFADEVHAVKRDLLRFLIEAKQEGKRVVGYGAAAKGNTLLNFCSIRNDFLDYVVDRSPHKQGCFLPGTHIPILAPERIADTRPDYILILPWNLRDEIVTQMAFVRDWGGRFVVPIPRVEVVS